MNQLKSSLIKINKGSTMCANSHEKRLVYSEDSKLINNNLIYNNEPNASATRTETNTQKLMRGALKSIINYVKQIYYFYNHLNNQFVSSTFYK